MRAVIKMNGDSVRFDEKQDFEQAKFHAAIPYAQAIHFNYQGEPHVMLVDEDGGPKGLAPNALATRMLEASAPLGVEVVTIVGDVFVMPNEDWRQG